MAVPALGAPAVRTISGLCGRIMTRKVFAVTPALALALLGANGTLAQEDAPAARPTDRGAGETIVVTGSAAALAAAQDEIARNPGGESLIDMAALDEKRVANLADALQYAPGVWAVSPTGDDNIYFTSRGSNLDPTYYDANGIKLLQDGLPVTTADGNNHNRVIDPLAARYATMARGANAMSYGSSTLGGAVNFATPTARDGDADSVSLTAGSHGLATGRLTLGRVFNDTVDGLFTVEGKSWDGYRDHNEQDRGGVYGNIGWQFSETGATRFYLTAIHNDSELAGPLTREQLETDPDQAITATVGNYQIDVDTTRLANISSWQIDGDRSLEFGLSFEEQSLFHPIVWSPFFSLLIDSDLQNAGTMLRYRQAAGAHELLFGLNYGESDLDGAHFSHTAGEPTELWALIANSGSTAELFALDRWQLSRDTTLVLAAQAVSAERDAMEADVPPGAVDHPRADYDRINPRIGVIHSIGGTASLYANLSSLYEPPTNFQLEDNVAGGNATLEAMHGTVVELGFRGGPGTGETGSVDWDVSFYRAEIDDEILSVDDPLAPGTSLATNVERTIHAGIEAVFRSTHRFGEGRLEPLVTFTANDFVFDSDAFHGDNELPAAPDWFARGELIYRSAGGYFLGPTFERVGERWADFANTYRVDGYTLLGLRTGFASGKWRAWLDVHNLTDEDYVAYHYVRDVAAPDAAILFPGEPLSVYVGFEMSLD
jgi:iron complex outermembrane receptor protein